MKGRGTYFLSKKGIRPGNGDEKPVYTQGVRLGIISWGETGKSRWEKT